MSILSTKRVYQTKLYFIQLKIPHFLNKTKRNIPNPKKHQLVYLVKPFDQMNEGQKVKCIVEENNINEIRETKTK